MRIAALTAAVLLALTLAGCATLSKQQCEAGDWESLGFADGLKGYDVTRFAEHQSACSEYGIVVDRQIYESGRQEGLKRYCTPQNAAKVGLAGEPYGNVCRGSAGDSFERVYRQAYNVYTIDQQIELAQSQIDSLTRQLAQADISASDRARIYSDLLYNQGQLGLLQQQRRNAEAALRSLLVTETEMNAPLPIQ